MSSVPPTQTGIASAVNNAVSRLASLLAVSVLALVLAHGFVATLRTLLAHSTLPVQAQQQMWANRARLHDIPLSPALSPVQRNQAARLLDKAHADVAKEEDDPAAQGLQGRALDHIAKAHRHVEEAISLEQ